LAGCSAASPPERRGPQKLHKEIWILHIPALEDGKIYSLADFFEIQMQCVYHRNRYWKGAGMEQMDRITRNPAVMGGKACIRGMRVTVSMVVGQIGAGHSIDELLSSYPYLEREDILQALRYAAWIAEDREVVLAMA
jgi:uncharacterized protein (DUF433 family)